jgi:hypothetical protein
MFEPDGVRSLLDAHIAEEVDNSARIWSLLVLELWQRQLAAGEALPTVESVT